MVMVPLFVLSPYGTVNAPTPTVGAVLSAESDGQRNVLIRVWPMFQFWVTPHQLVPLARTSRLSTIWRYTFSCSMYGSRAVRVPNAWQEALLAGPQRLIEAAGNPFTSLAARVGP